MTERPSERPLLGIRRRRARERRAPRRGSERPTPAFDRRGRAHAARGSSGAARRDQCSRSPAGEPASSAQLASFVRASEASLPVRRPSRRAPSVARRIASAAAYLSGSRSAAPVERSAPPPDRSAFVSNPAGRRAASLASPARGEQPARDINSCVAQRPARRPGAYRERRRVRADLDERAEGRPRSPSDTRRLGNGRRTGPTGKHFEPGAPSSRLCRNERPKCSALSNARSRPFLFCFSSQAPTRRDAARARRQRRQQVDATAERRDGPVGKLRSPSTALCVSVSLFLSQSLSLSSEAFLFHFTIDAVIRALRAPTLARDF